MRYQPRHAAGPPRHLRPGRSPRPGVAAVSIALLAVLVYLASEQQSGQPWPASPAQAAPSASMPAGGAGPVAGGVEPTAAGSDDSAAVSSSTTGTAASDPASTIRHSARAADRAAVTTGAAQEPRSTLPASTTTPRSSQGPSAVTDPLPPTTTAPLPSSQLDEGGGPNHQPGCDPQPELGQDGEHGHAQCEAPAG